MSSVFRHVPKYTAFLAVFVLVNTLIGWLAWNLMLSWAGESRLDRALRESIQETHIIVMGDSHPLCAVDDRFLPGALNLSKVGHNYDIVYGKLEETLARYPGQIDLVVLPLDYHGFTLDRALFRTDEIHVARYENTPYLAYRIGFNRLLLRRTLRLWLFPHFGILSREYSEIDHRILFERLVALRPDGLKDVPDMHQRLNNGIKLHFGSRIWWEPVFADYLGWTLDMCARHNIRAVLVRYPLSDAYRAAVSDWLPVDAWEQRVNQVLSQHRVAAVLDYRLFFQGRDECFVDAAGHVHNSYAPEFTRQLLRDLRECGLVEVSAGKGPEPVGEETGR